MTGPRLLVANRGEIARRILRTAREMGIGTVAVYDPDDRELPHVAEADIAIELLGTELSTGYLDGPLVLAAAEKAGATLIHPGYGFLSENAAFARAAVDAGLAWVGPSPEAISAMGDKIRAKQQMTAVAVPVLAGSDGPVHDADEAVRIAEKTGFPVMVKASAGGGGMGMEIVRDPAALPAAVERVRSRGERLFADGAVLIEQYVERSRHIEVQIFGLSDGRVVALGERDCSVQRRHQKVAEESPSPYVDEQLRQDMYRAAAKAGEAISYRNAGTVEFIVDVPTRRFYFLEMNTRLQVEHPVTEAVTGIDLVREQLLLAMGLAPTFDPSSVTLRGHALELRVYAEDPDRFLPSPGLITGWSEPVGAGIRVDSGYVLGNRVTPRFDPLLAKVITYGGSRDEALELARRAAADFEVEGPKTNLAFLRRLLDDHRFSSGDYDTGLVAAMTATTAATASPRRSEENT